MRPRVAPTLLLLLCLATLAPGCSPTPRGRALLIGVDGASMRVIEPMLAAGELPNLAAIAREGVSGTIRSQKPIDSPPIWNTVVTGMHPRKHGIRGFAHKDEDGSRHLFLSTDRKVPAIWNIAAAGGLRVGVVNFWNTYPPDELDGVIVSDHVLAREIDGRALVSKTEIPGGRTTVHPAHWHEKIVTLLGGDHPPLSQVPNPFVDNDRLPPWVKTQELVRRYEEDAALARIALAIEQEERPDLLMVLLPGVDRVSHYLWGNVEPAELYPPRLRPTPEAREAGAEALRSFYRFADSLVGVLAADYGPDDLVLVMSDHGFEAGTSLFLLTGKHESEAAIDGVLFVRGRGVGPKGSRVANVSVKDVTPTLLAWLGIPVAADMDGRPFPFIAAPPLITIDSYASLPTPKVTTAPSGMEEEIVERLRMLGYLEEDDGLEEVDEPAEDAAEGDASGPSGR